MAGFGAAGNGGAVDIISDGEVPRSFTGRARTVISGGQYVTVSGAANVVGSTAQIFIPGSIVIDLMGADLNQVVGIALHNVGSNETLGVATRGFYLATSADVISGGYPVYPISGTVQGLLAAIGVAGSVQPVGRAITAAASGTNLFTLVNFHF